MMEIQALIKVRKHCWRMRNGWLRVISSFPTSFSKDGLIDCMVFNTVYNSISVILQRPVHLSIFSWVVLTITPHNVLSKALAAFPHNHCRNNGQQWERNELCRNDCHQSSERILAKQGIEPATSCSWVCNGTDGAIGLDSRHWQLLKINVLDKLKLNLWSYEVLLVIIVA